MAKPDIRDAHELALNLWLSELQHIKTVLQCFCFEELVLRGKDDYGCLWKVPPAFVMQSTADVYSDLAWIQRTPCVIPREFFSIPSVERLEYVHICPVRGTCSATLKRLALSC